MRDVNQIPNFIQHRVVALSEIRRGKNNAWNDVLINKPLQDLTIFLFAFFVVWLFFFFGSSIFFRIHRPSHATEVTDKFWKMIG